MREIESLRTKLKLYFNFVKVGNVKARILNESEIEEFYDENKKERKDN